jgi:SulP family sulfate permease
VRTSRGPAWADLTAALAVVLVLIPQGVAYATLAGVPPAAGLVASGVASLAAAPLASSPYLQTGVTAFTSLLTLGAIAHAPPGEELEWAMLLALLVGVMRLALGLVRAGWIAYLVSEPVLAGLLPAVALVIIAQQLPSLLGFFDAPEGSPVVSGARALGEPDSWRLAALAFGAVALLALALQRRIDPRVPLIALVTAAAVVVSDVRDYAGPVIGDMQAGWPPSPLDLPWAEAATLLVPALVIAVVGFIEPTAIARDLAASGGGAWDADRELVAQGTANVAAGVAGGLPVGGSFSRTALNRAAGARTRWSGAIVGALTLAFLPFASVLEPLPRAVPAAIVIGAVAAMLNPSRLMELARWSRPQVAIAALTLVLVVWLAPRLDLALAAGIGAALLLHLWRESHLVMEVEAVDDELHVRPAGVLWFGSAHRFERELTKMLEKRHPSALVLELDGLGRIDVSGAEAISRVVDDAEGRGVPVRIEGIPPTTGGMLARVVGDGPEGG